MPENCEKFVRFIKRKSRAADLYTSITYAVCGDDAPRPRPALPPRAHTREASHGVPRQWPCTSTTIRRISRLARHHFADVVMWV